MAFNENIINEDHGITWVNRALEVLIPKGNDFTMWGFDWSTVYWNENNPDPKPTEAEITAKAEELRVAGLYQRPRRLEYPFLREQIDLLWHAIDDGTLDKTSDFYTKLKAAKDKWPKDNSGPIE